MARTPRAAQPPCVDEDESQILRASDGRQPAHQTTSPRSSLTRSRSGSSHDSDWQDTRRTASCLSQRDDSSSPIQWRQPQTKESHSSMIRRMATRRENLPGD
eukprot:342363-Pyramimonas_sp.AAC.1